MRTARRRPHRATRSSCRCNTALPRPRCRGWSQAERHRLQTRTGQNHIQSGLHTGGGPSFWVCSRMNCPPCTQASKQASAPSRVILSTACGSTTSAKASSFAMSTAMYLLAFTACQCSTTHHTPHPSATACAWFGSTLAPTGGADARNTQYCACDRSVWEPHCQTRSLVIDQR